MKKHYRKNRSIKLKHIDAVMKNIIRLRDDMTCQLCGKKIINPQDAQTSHIRSKKFCPQLRHDQVNFLLTCFRCHNLWHNDPLPYVNMFNKKFPARAEYIEKAAIEKILPKLKPKKEQERRRLLLQQLKEIEAGLK